VLLLTALLAVTRSLCVPLSLSLAASLIYIQGIYSLSLCTVLPCCCAELLCPAEER